MTPRGSLFDFLILVFIILGSPAYAGFDRQRSIEFTMAAGISSPTDDYAGIADAGSAYEFGCGFTPRTVITLGIEYGTSSNPFSRDAEYFAEQDLGASIRAAEFSSTHLGVYAKFLASDKPTTVYARASVGEWRGETNYKTDESTYFDSISYTGFLIGLGFQAPLMSHIAAFSEISYTGFDLQAAQINSDIQILIGLQFIIPAH